jgi:hypothetical protein
MEEFFLPLISTDGARGDLFCLTDLLVLRPELFFWVVPRFQFVIHGKPNPLNVGYE